MHIRDFELLWWGLSVHIFHAGGKRPAQDGNTNELNYSVLSVYISPSLARHQSGKRKGGCV